MPNDIELGLVNQSGDLTEIKLGGTGIEKVVLTDEKVKALFGNYTFDLNLMFIDGDEVIELDAGTLNIGQDATDTNLNSPGVLLTNLTISKIESSGLRSATTKEWVEGKFGNFEFLSSSLIGGGEFGTVLSFISIPGSPESRTLDIGQSAQGGIRFSQLDNATIDTMGAKSVVTKEWVESKITGASGSFTAQSGEVVTVVDGLITTII